MGGSKTQLSFVLWIVLIGLTACVLAQGRGRRVRVRKTGEFGRRISPISTSYQPPPRERSGSDPYFETSETRRSGSVLGIPKPSQSLQLPIFTPPDQEAEESGENVQGYAYPDPSSGSSSSSSPTDTDAFSNNNQKPPILEFPQEVDEQQQQELDAAPVPVSPERLAELPPRGSRPVPLKAEAEESIGAEGIGGSPVRQSPSAQTNSDCGENDDSCWPGGYKSEIPGDAGTDYPILSEIVDTSFDCDSVQYSGYYADTDEISRCQMFHVCLKGNAYRRTQKWSFLCPNGTVFSQNDFVCVWWNAAPECNSGVVNELSLRNEELGWDNLTEADQQGTAGFDVKSAMSSLANTNLQSSSTNSRLKNSLPEDSRRPGRVRQGNGGNGNPYRVPVKVNTETGARTKLKEVSHNSLQGGDQYGGVEHFGEESETFETSLRHQSEARRKTKSGSALAKSESEAYEQKSVSDSVSPFIVTRGGDGGSSDDYSSSVEDSGREEGGYEGTSVVMMDAQQRNPDGSEGIAQVPVRMEEGGGGYRYPVPTGTPAPAYLPPRMNELSATTSSSSSGAGNEIPTSTFLPQDNSDDQAGYVYQTPEYSQQLLQDPGTTEEAGYRYPTPTTTEKTGYNYEAPSTTTEQSAEYNLEEAPSTTEREGGYNNNNNNNNNVNYEVPSTTEQQEEEGYKYPQPSTTETSSAVTEEEYSTNSLKPVFDEERNGGYAYEPSTSPRVPTTTYGSTTTTTSTSTNQDEAELGSLEATTVGTNGGYLPPSKEGYSALQVHSAGPEVLALPNGGSEEDNKDALGLEEVSSGELSTNAPGGGDGGGYGGSREETTTGLNIPTPSSTLPGGTHLDSADSPGRQDKVNEILEQIKLGGAEVRDENGNKIDFAQLQKLILSTPNGQLALQKADESTTTATAASSSGSSSAASEATEASVASPATPEVSGETAGEENTEETPSAGGYEEPATSVSASPTLETVQPIEDFVVNRRGPPTQSYGQPQESYFTNNRLVSSRHENYDISAPAKEYENHSVEQNSIDGNAAPLAGASSGGVRNSFGGSAPGLPGYSTSSYESQRLSNQGQPQGLISQNFIGTPFQRQQQQQQQEQVGFSSVRPSVPQPQQYYQQQGGLSTRVPEASYFSQSQSTVPTQQSSSYNFQPQQGQQQQQSQGPTSYFEPAFNQYLPPVSSTSQSGAYRESSTQDKFRSAVALGSNIQLQQSYNVPLPQASSINRKLVNPGDIKIVPALFVHQHTRVENPDGSPVASNNNFQKTSNSYAQSEGRFNGQFNIQSSRSAYIPYASQNVPVRVRAPRLAGFTRRDVFPLPKKVESFTLEDGRTKEQVEGETRKYQRIQRKGEDSLGSQSSGRTRRRRRGSRSGPQGQLEGASNDPAASASNIYPGKA